MFFVNAHFVERSSCCSRVATFSRKGWTIIRLVHYVHCLLCFEGLGHFLTYRKANDPADGHSNDHRGVPRVVQFDFCISLLLCRSKAIMYGI